MKVLGINWVGVKTDAFGPSCAFFTDVMGLEISYRRADFAVLELPDGDKLEFFGPGGPDPESQFRHNQVVAGFWVADIEGARAELLAGGAELLGELEGTDGGYQWQHFRAPDGKVFELCSDPGRALPD